MRTTFELFVLVYLSTCMGWRCVLTLDYAATSRFTIRALTIALADCSRFDIKSRRLSSSMFNPFRSSLFAFTAALYASRAWARRSTLFNRLVAAFRNRSTESRYLVKASPWMVEVCGLVFLCFAHWKICSLKKGYQEGRCPACYPLFIQWLLCWPPCWPLCPGFFWLCLSPWPVCPLWPPPCCC
jgi:hypothetical protein